MTKFSINLENWNEKKSLQNWRGRLEAENHLAFAFGFSFLVLTIAKLPASEFKLVAASFRRLRSFIVIRSRTTFFSITSCTELIRNPARTIFLAVLFLLVLSRYHRWINRWFSKWKMLNIEQSRFSLIVFQFSRSFVSHCSLLRYFSNFDRCG